MTLKQGTDRLESDRLVLRRVVPDDLPFYTHLHALPEVAEHLYPRRPAALARRDESMDGVRSRAMSSYALGYLAVVRKADAALIGRCGLMDLVVESAAARARDSQRMVRARTRAR